MHVWHTWLLTHYDRKLIISVTLIIVSLGGAGREKPTSSTIAASGDQEELEPFPGVCWCLKDLESDPYLTSLPRKSEVAERICILGMEGVEWGCTCSKLPSPIDPEPSKHQKDSQTLDRNFSSSSYGRVDPSCSVNMGFGKKRRGLWCHGSQQRESPHEQGEEHLLPVSTVLVLSQLLRAKREFIPMVFVQDMLLWDILPKNKMLPEIQRSSDWDILREKCLSIREILT